MQQTRPTGRQEGAVEKLFLLGLTADSTREMRGKHIVLLRPLFKDCHAQAGEGLRDGDGVVMVESWCGKREDLKKEGWGSVVKRILLKV